MNEKPLGNDIPNKIIDSILDTATGKVPEHHLTIAQIEKLAAHVKTCMWCQIRGAFDPNCDRNSADFYAQVEREQKRHWERLKEEKE